MALLASFPGIRTLRNHLAEKQNERSGRHDSLHTTAKDGVEEDGQRLVGSVDSPLRRRSARGKPRGDLRQNGLPLETNIVL